MSSSQSPARPVTMCPVPGCGGKWTSAGGNDKGNCSRHESTKQHQNAVLRQQQSAAAAVPVPEVQVQVQEVVAVHVQEVAPVVAVVPVQALMAYPNQITAAKQVISTFKDGCHWAVLLACPQSGKTQTFYYVACHMLCNHPDMDRVVVVCGNAENELSAQLRASKTEFIRLYVQTEHAYLSADLSESVIRMLEARIQVWCGADLKHNATHPTSARNTLFIWEEAHYAQDKTNRPHKFFKNLCITADGEISNLEGERNNYVLTVSATPFSELSNIWHHGQKKRVVRLEPAQGYKGPRHFLAAGAIVQFDPRLSCEEVVAQAIAEAPIMAAPKYAIVRVRDYKGKDNMAACIRVAVEHGWAYRVYDSETKYTQANSMQSMDELAVVPERNTLILIRGMCRMGKRVPKDHISFVIETSKDSDTDTVLQALLGRMFGYHDNMTIKVYISNKVDLAEIDRYVRMMENPDDMPLQTMPRRGKNLVAGSNQSDNGWYPNVPIIVRADADAEEEHDDDDPNAAEYEKELTIRAIQAAFASGAAENHNCADQTAEIRQQIMQLTDEPERMSAKNFMNRRGNRINDTYKDMPDKLRDSIAQRSPLNAGSSAGCGFESNREDGMQVNVWRCNTNQFSQSHGFYPGDLIVDTRTRATSPQQQLHVRIPCTTGSETFSTQQEDGSVVIGNGGYSIPLAVETSHDAALMQLNLCDLIRESQIEDSLQRPKCVTSNHDGVSDWKGIIVTVGIMQALQRGGAIYEYIKREHGATLKITKVIGRELKSLKNMGNARLTKIEWS